MTLSRWWRFRLWLRGPRARNEHELLRQAAEIQMRRYGQHIALVSREVADQWRVWSPPVQIMTEPRPDGLLDLLVRKIPDEETTPA
jgi:hypothetical protein